MAGEGCGGALEDFEGGALEDDFGAVYGGSGGEVLILYTFKIIECW